MPTHPSKYFIYFILCSFLLLAVTGPAQDSNPRSDTLVPLLMPIPVSEIPEGINTFNTSRERLDNILKVDDDIMAVDSVFNLSKAYLSNTRDDFYRMEEIGMSRRNYEISKREWLHYLSQLNAQRKIVNERIKELQSAFDQLNEAEQKWILTKENAIENNVSEELIGTTRQTIKTITSYKDQIRERQDAVVVIYKDISAEILEIDQIITDIEEGQKQIQKKLLQKDSPVLWRAFDGSYSFESLKSKIVPSIRNNYRIIDVYLTSNITTLYYQLLLLVMLSILFIYLKRKSNLTAINTHHIPEVKSALVALNPVSTAFILGIVISIFFYSNRPITLTEFLVILILVPVTILVPKLAGGSIKRDYYIVLILYIINNLHAYVFVYAGVNRLILMLLTVILFYVLIRFRKHKSQLKLKEKGFWLKSINFVNNLYIILLAVSILTNITGHVRFSSDLFDAVIISSIFGVITYILTITLTSLISVLTLEKGYHPFQLISRYHSLLNKRLRPFIEMLGLFFWVYVTLVSFSVYELFINWVGKVMDETWTLGAVEISLGGIISFIIVILITILITRAVGIVFKDEWLKRTKIPRGIPEAISMTLRYIIIGFGFYLALSAAGVDLGKFGLLAGALGVGIGFGLQNIVYNFIAGLVLSYERPIHVGDTVEVEQLIGNVTEIGVRSSKIKTFDGSEVIVPNGNLISNQVINWTLSDQTRRLKIPVRTTLQADPVVILKMLKEAAAEHPNTLKNPEPLPLFEGYGDSSLDFTLYFWVHFNVGLGTKSDVALKIYDRLKSENLHVPVPMRRIYYENNLKELSDNPNEKPVKP